MKAIRVSVDEGKGLWVLSDVEVVVYLAQASLADRHKLYG